MDPKEKQLEEFREDLRKMGPDGTYPSLWLPLKTSESEKGILEGILDAILEGMQCPPEFLDVLNENRTEMLP